MKKPTDTTLRRSRTLKQTVRTAKKRTAASTQWLERQLNDPYVAAAKAGGYRSRAAFKLLQLQEQFKLLRPGYTVVDLGAAPGGWSQVAAEIVGAKGTVLALDILPMTELPGVTFLEGDFTEAAMAEKLLALIKNPPDIVLSDMAAPTTGHNATDHLRVIALAELALDFSLRVLRPGGHFLVKVFQGGATNTLLNLCKQNFRQVKHVKPPASRKESAELYLLALDRKA
jgi:23S rRNA (uridine2552-2'-O)-methyltransferase